MPNCDLYFNIVSGLLSGTVDGTAFYGFAFCGGRAGSKKAGAAHEIIANNPLFTRLKLNEKEIKKGSVGSPLPMCKYTLRNHESRPNWIRLIALEFNVMHDRDGFAIHGRGQRGSDGCIVPDDFQIVQKLVTLIEKRKAIKKPEVTLHVQAIGDIDYFIKKVDTYSRRA